MFTVFMENHSVPLLTPLLKQPPILLTFAFSFPFRKQTNFTMLAKTVAFFALVAAAQAIHTGGLYDNTLSLGTQSEATVRGFGGLSTVSHQSKAIDSAHASVRKYDSRVTNDAAFAARPIGYAGYAAPALAHGYAAAPAVAYGHGPAAVAYGHGYAAPAIAAHGYAAPAIAAHGYAAPAIAHGYAAPALAHGYAAPVAKAVGYGGLAYSPAAAVATHSFNGFGISYGY